MNKAEKHTKSMSILANFPHSQLGQPPPSRDRAAETGLRGCGAPVSLSKRRSHRPALPSLSSTASPTLAPTDFGHKLAVKLTAVVGKTLPVYMSCDFHAERRAETVRIGRLPARGRGPVVTPRN